MRIGFDALAARADAPDEVARSIRGLLPALVAASEAEDRWIIYAGRHDRSGLPFDDPRVEQVVPWWPVGWRSGQITWEQFRLYSRVFRDRVDLLHAPAYAIPRLTVKPTVVTIPDLFALRRPEISPRRWRRHLAYILPYSLRLARRVIVPSEDVRREILAWNAEQASPPADLDERIAVIPWGVATHFHDEPSPERRDEVAYRYGLPPKFVLVFGPAGEMRMNVKRAVEAFFAATLSRRLPHRLVLLGPPARDIETLLHQLGLDAKTVRISRVAEEDLPVVYRLASLLLHPVLASGFGFPVLESLACGTPVVCSDLPAFRAIAEDAARYVPADDLPRLREAVEVALTEPEANAAMAAAGRGRAARFSWATCATRVLALYRDVIREDRARFR